MTWRVGARILVYLRRIAKAEERQAEALETLARLAVDKFQRVPSTRKAVFGTYDPAALLKERILRGEVPEERE